MFGISFPFLEFPKAPLTVVLSLLLTFQRVPLQDLFTAVVQWVHLQFFKGTRETLMEEGERKKENILLFHQHIHTLV